MDYSFFMHRVRRSKKQEFHLYFPAILCQDGAMNIQNPEEMAKAYLDAWQAQWAQLAADPAWQQSAQQQFQQFAQNMMGGMPMTPTSANVRHDDPRSSSSAPAPDLGASLLAECFTRLARLEARVADLERSPSK
jgi:hypothetical protein